MQAHLGRRLVVSRGFDIQIQGCYATTSTTTTTSSVAVSRHRCIIPRQFRPFSTGIVSRDGRLLPRSISDFEALRLQMQMERRRDMQLDALKYSRWSKDALIQRIRELESEAQARAGPGAASANAGAPGGESTSATGSGTEARAGAGAEAGPDAPQPRGRPTDRKLDPSKYSTRLVALKLAYLGGRYGGFEFQASSNVPTVEEELWKALVRACLITPEDPAEVRLEDPRWEYSKCGRTDRGVSAFGQVVGIRLRSNRPLPEEEKEKEEEGKESEGEGEEAQDPLAGAKARRARLRAEKARPFDDVADEIHYPKVLNRILPRDIRVLAWCPTLPEGFSARHDCRERQYRYFFTQPAFPPVPASLENPNPPPPPGGPSASKKKPAEGAEADDDGKKTRRIKEGWLDIAAMRDAAKRFEGLHDFRNFCKVDSSKLITNFERRIFEADVVEVPGGSGAAGSALPFLSGPEFRTRNVAGDGDGDADGFPKVYYVHVRGSAFLWHQIRCMVAVLFMVGQGLEPASVVDRLLDVAAQPCRPNYVLASEAPLVLWDCIFPAPEEHQDPNDPDFDPARRSRADALPWARLGDGVTGAGSTGALDRHNGVHGLADDLWALWRERKMDELLSAQLLGVVAGHEAPAPSSSSAEAEEAGASPDTTTDKWRDRKKYASSSQRLFEGGNRAHVVGRYQSVLAKALLPSPEETYEREARKRGFRSVAEWREARASKKRAEIEAQGGVWVTRGLGRGRGAGAGLDEDADE